ncbi:MAG TPA: MoaD/ThiS family protein [Firmicutes bacterium]|nr:MoaD/ThiS family protein [Bacillota bacterium]
MTKVRFLSVFPDLTGGRRESEVEGRTLREIIASLDEAFPGIKARMIGPGGTLYPGFMVLATRGGKTEPCRPELDMEIGDVDEVIIAPVAAGG